MRQAPSTLAVSGNLIGPDTIILGFILVVSCFVIWMIVDCVKHETSEQNLKLIWLLVILFAPFGSLIYFFVRKISRPLPPSR